MRIAVAASLLVLTLVGCETVPAPPACPVGQEPMRTAQLFFGQKTPGAPAVSDAQFRIFLDAEVRPRFPGGVTVLEGGDQWKGAENRLIREASKVVVLVLPKRDERRVLGEVRAAFIQRFNQDAVMLINPETCVAL